MTVIGPAALQSAILGQLQAGLVAAEAAVTPDAATALPQASGKGAPSAANPVLQAAARLASQQGGLAPLYADLDALLTRADLPPAVREAAQAVLALRMAVPDAGALKNAVLNSGLFSEAMLAAGQAPQGDLKSALLSLRQTLQSWLGAANPERASPSSLPPPHRGAMPMAQQPALPSIMLLDAPETGARLLAQTDAAIARHTLLQIASLPDVASPQQHSDASSKLTLDIPLATPQGTAVIQLQIERDGERKESESGREQTWRINLAIDVEPLGPVRASVSQSGGLTHVAMFAERRDSARALRDDLGMLEIALAEAALEVGDLHCRTGVPKTDPAPAGLFVDRAS